MVSNYHLSKEMAHVSVSPIPNIYIVKQGLALLDMYNSFGKPQQLQPWSSGDPCENGWIGTTCGIGKLQNRVVQL